MREEDQSIDENVMNGVEGSNVTMKGDKSHQDDSKETSVNHLETNKLPEAKQKIKSQLVG